MPGPEADVELIRSITEGIEASCRGGADAMRADIPGVFFKGV